MRILILICISVCRERQAPRLPQYHPGAHQHTRQWQRWPIRAVAAPGETRQDTALEESGRRSRLLSAVLEESGRRPRLLSSNTSLSLAGHLLLSAALVESGRRPSLLSAALEESGRCPRLLSSNTSLSLIMSAGNGYVELEKPHTRSTWSTVART